MKETIYKYIKKECERKRYELLRPDHVTFKQIKDAYHMKHEDVYAIVLELYMEGRVQAGKTLNDNWVKII